MREPEFDILSGIPGQHPVWVETVKGLSNARQRMEEIATEKSGQYFIFCEATHEILARVETFATFQRAVPRYPNLEAALEIIRKTGHSVGEPAVVDQEPRVLVDGQPRTYEQIFEMVEEYIKRRTA